MINKIIFNILIFFVKIYQVFLSPIIGQNCRYLPTCSEYTIQCLKEHGMFKGLILSLKRISKCHPWGSHGYDPVPSKIKDK